MSPEEPASDERLLQQACRGNKGSLDRLFGRHRDRLWRLLLRLADDRAEAEDLLQETFLRALKGSRSFRGQGKFSTWLYAIALNLVRSKWRRQGRTPREVSGDPDALAQAGLGARSRDTANDPSALAERMEASQRVRLAVESLPEPQRVAIVLSRYEGMSYEEISRIEDCSIDAVKQRVRRAMIRLSESLKGLDL